MSVEDRNKLLNYKTVGAVFELFDECYKRGVFHAEVVDDMDEVDDFINNFTQPMKYGQIVGTDRFGRRTGITPMSLYDWQLTLRQMIRDASSRLKRNIVDHFISLVNTDNTHLGVFYEICMDFYMQGLVDYYTKGACDKKMFINTRLIEYGTMRKRTTDSMIGIVQSFCMSRKQLYKGEDAYYQTRRYDTFSVTLFNIVRGRRAAKKYMDKVFNTAFIAKEEREQQKQEEAARILREAEIKKIEEERDDGTP